MQYNNTNLRTFQEKKFNSYNKQTLTHTVPHGPQSSKITFDYPKHNLPHSVAPTQVQNYPHNYIQGNNHPQTINRQPVEIQIKKVNTAQKISNTGLGSQSTVDKRFMPLSYEKVSVIHEESNGKRIDGKEYSKQTVLTVLLGFLVLMVIVGTFYGIILYDKSKTPSESIAGNITPGSNSVMASSVKAVKGNSGEWKTLPQDESSPLNFLEHQETAEDTMLHMDKNFINQGQSHIAYTHMRKHID